MKRKISLILAVIMLVSVLSGIVSAAALPAGKILGDTVYSWDCESDATRPYHGWQSAAVYEDGAIKLSGDGYNAQNFCTGRPAVGNYNLKSGKTYALTFKVKGATGNNICADADPYNGQFTGFGPWYTITQTDVWEEVTYVFTFSGSNPPSSDPTAFEHGYAFRIYDVDNNTVYVDDIKINEVVDAPTPEPSLDITQLDETINGGYVLLAPNTEHGYGAFYQRLPLTIGETYTVVLGIVSNNLEIPVTFGIEGPSGIAEVDVTPTAVGEIYTPTFQITPTEAADHAQGYAARVYVNAPKKGQVIVGGLVVLDSNGNVVAYQDFTAPTLTAATPTWTAGANTSYVPYVEPLTDITALEATKDGGYVLLMPGKTGNYGMFGMNGSFESGKTYTITADMMVNDTSIAVMTDMDPVASTTTYKENPATEEEWGTFKAEVTPSANANSIRIYVNEDTNGGMVAIKNIVVTDANGNKVASCSCKDEVATHTSPWIAESAKWIASVVPPTKLQELDIVKERDYMFFENSASAPNAGYYMRAKLDSGKEYTISFDVISNNPDVVILTDMEGNGGVATQGGKVTAVDKWETVSYKFTPSGDWSGSSDNGTATHGWPLRVYTAGAMDAQTAIDNIVVKDSDGKVILSQDFKKSDMGDIPTWGIGKYTHIPLGFVAEKEGEILGYNEIINGDFEDSSKMKYWWFRTDWNCKWEVQDGKGYEGSKGLVAIGTGAENNGCFYTIAGEGVEASLALKAGKTYVLEYKVFRPEGVDSYTYIDINEGQVTNGTATKNGEWETVTARFVAPEGPVKIRLVVNKLASGEYVVFDDIEIRQVDGDPNGNPDTADNMLIGVAVAAMVVSAAGIVVLKKRVFSK